MSYAGYIKLDTADVLDVFYPVGSIYLSVSSDFDPNISWKGTWELVPGGYCLWTATSDAGNTISQGAPNLYGVITAANNTCFGTNFKGCFSDSNTTSSYNQTYTGQGYGRDIYFDASRSNSIYGNSTRVQPPAYKVYAWKRTA